MKVNGEDVGWVRDREGEGGWGGWGRLGKWGFRGGVILGRVSRGYCRFK